MGGDVVDAFTAQPNLGRMIPEPFEESVPVRTPMSVSAPWLLCRNPAYRTKLAARDNQASLRYWPGPLPKARLKALAKANSER